MYTGTMIEELIATVERAESWAVAETVREEDLPVAYLLDQSYNQELMEVV